MQGQCEHWKYLIPITTKFIPQKQQKKSEFTFKHYFLGELIETQKQDLQKRIAITKWSVGSLNSLTILFHFALERQKREKTPMQWFLECR